MHKCAPNCLHSKRLLVVVATCGLDIVNYSVIKVQAKFPCYPINIIWLHHFPLSCRYLHNNMLTEIPEELFATTTQLQGL